jgi:hypothetical protein
MPFPTGEWRNWQTRRIQVPVSERTWGFNSPLAHYGKLISWIGSGIRRPLPTMKSVVPLPS